MATARAKAVARPRAAASSKAAPGSDVERRWKEYWASRTKLEAAVEQVKRAREALHAAQETERECRTGFEAIKASLTELLDVESPAGPTRAPTPIAARPATSPGLPAPAPENAARKPVS